MSRNRADWTEHVERFAARGARAQQAVDAVVASVGARREKMGNRVTVVDGIKFPSRLEADRYRELVLLRASGEVRWFTRQVPFDVAPGVTYRADFLVVWNLGGTVDKITVEDTKGFLTDKARVKLAVVEHRYGFKVQILTRAMVRR